MSSAVALWSIVVKPGTPVSFIPMGDIRITGAALDAKLSSETARSSVKLTYTPVSGVSEDEDDDEDEVEAESIVLCSLTPGKIEQSPLNLVVVEDVELTFEVVGENAIHLSGNYILQNSDFPADSDEEDSEFDEEDAYHLDEVSSDVLEEADDLMDEDSDSEEGAHIEEVEDDEDEKKEETKAAAASKKRPLEEADNEGEKLTKSQKKKLTKKLKAENGQAVPVEGKSEEKKDEPKKAKEGDKKDKKAQKSEKKEGEKSQKEEKKPAGELKTTDSGLKIKDVKVGSGKTVKKGDSVSMRYIGKFTDGKVFDSNTKGSPFKFTIGRNEVIKGWEEGILGMQAGGERLLIVPPKLGYGSRKMDGIPANSTLRFEVKLLSIN